MNSTGSIPPPVPSAARSDAFLLRRRNDLQVYPQRCRSRRVWVIKDPVTLRYFQFREEEFAILQWLDGHCSLEQIKSLFEQRFAPQRMTVTRLQQFVANLHRNSLVISGAVGQGQQLWQRAATQQRDSWLAMLSNPLAIRFRGIDPQPLLRWMYPSLGWMFSRGCIVICLLIVLIAVGLVCGRLDQFQTRLPELNALLSPGNLVWLAVALAATKVLHELGHALTCQHFGGHCHEMGVMLLVFTPCLYCNVSDAWKLSDRWQRMAITAAGIYVELVLASICTILWWFSAPGFFHALCLNVMVVCSLGTLLLNGNPLLRYDGYYILSDLMETPNLWQDSRARLTRWVSRFFWGYDPGNAVSLRQRGGWLLWYAIASSIYRVFIVTSLLYLVYSTLKPLGLLLLAQIIGIMVVVGVVAIPLRSVWRTLSNPIVRKQVRPRRVMLAIAALAGIAGLAGLVPLPCRVAAPVSVQPRDARRIYVAVPGELVDAAKIGQRVQAGEMLGQLQNVQLRGQYEAVQGQYRRQLMRVQSLESLRGRDSELAAQLPTAKEILADLEQRLQQLKGDVEALTIMAPASGTVLPPPSVMSEIADTSQLVSWTGTPLDPPNRGCTLERKTLFCLVGEPDSWEAIVYLNQADVRYIRPGQAVRLSLDVAPGRVLTGTITGVAGDPVQTLPRELAVSQQVANRVDGSRQSRPVETTYQAHVQFESDGVPLLIGATGQAKVTIEPQPLGQRLYRFLTRTFKPVL